MQENEEKLREVLSSVLSIDKNTINDNISKNNVESWDSYNALMLVSELENAFGIQCTIDEAVTIQSVRDIRELLSSHGVRFL